MCQIGFCEQHCTEALALVRKQSLLRKLFKKFRSIQFRLVTMTDTDYVKVEYNKVSETKLSQQICCELCTDELHFYLNPTSHEIDSRQSQPSSIYLLLEYA